MLRQVYLYAADDFSGRHFQMLYCWRFRIKCGALHAFLSSADFYLFISHEYHQKVKKQFGSKSGPARSGSKLFAIMSRRQKLVLFLSNNNKNSDFKSYVQFNCIDPENKIVSKCTFSPKSGS